MTKSTLASDIFILRGFVTAFLCGETVYKEIGSLFLGAILSYAIPS